MIVYIIFLSLGTLLFFLHIFFSKKNYSALDKAELFLLYQLVFTVSLTSFLAFYGLNFMGQYVADITNWPACPFEELLGNVNFSYGVLGFLCIWIRGNFWVAVVLGQSIWLLADAVTHIKDMVKNNNYSSGNVGIPLIMAIAIPIYLLAALGVYEYLKRKENKTNLFHK